MRCFYQLSEKPPDPDLHTGFGFYAKAVRMEKSPVLAIAWLKF